MAIKISGNEVITDAYVLREITDTDAATKTAINNALLAQGNALVIYASDGTAAKTIYGATTTPI